MTPVPEHAVLTLDDTVTGEAVAIDLPPAGIGTRMLSGLLDVVATTVVLVACAFVFILASAHTDAALQHVAIISTSVVGLLVFPTTVETLSRGRSVGKWVTGLRVVRDDAGPIQAQHAFVRALIGVVEIWVLSGAGALVSVLVSPRGKRLGDYAAGTYVVRDRTGLHLPPPTPMPPELATWARQADIAALPTSLALGVRQYLARAASLSPQAREEVGRRLTTQVSAYVAPAPPSPVPDEVFLAAVMAARRERDLARLERERDLRTRLSGGGTPGR